MTEQYTWRRVGLLLRADIIERYRNWLMVVLVLTIVMLLRAAQGAATGNLNDGLYPATFGTMLFVWGAILVSNSFIELHDNARNISYLLLPASALEKVAARLALVTVVFVLFLLAVTTLVSLATEGANQLLFGRHNRVFRPYDPAVWRSIAVYVAGCAPLFLGAAWFRKSHLLKTFLAVTAIALGLLLLGVLPMRLLFGGSYYEMSWPLFVEDWPLWTRLTEHLATISRIAYYALLPPFCWFVAWLRVRETQVSDGV